MGKPIIDDELWVLIEPLLLPLKPRREKNPGRLPVSNRAALTGILFVLKTGLRWRDLPAEMGCGPGVTCWQQLRDWQAAGVWDRLHELLLAKLRTADQIDFSRAAVDSSSIRAAGAGQKLGQTLPIERDPVPSTTLSPTPTARHWSALSRWRWRGINRWCLAGCSGCERRILGHANEKSPGFELRRELLAIERRA